jgi:NAD(P)-dependent dehydrogenase (short-subunit alcohol dehydrogenase family)
MGPDAEEDEVDTLTVDTAPMRRLDGRVAIVVGSATGIGAATSARLAREGATVVLADINVEEAERTAARITDAGGKASAVAADVGDDATIGAMVSATIERFGRIDAVHSNAADTSTQTSDRDLDVVEIGLDVWDHIMRVNLRGHVLVLRHTIPHMLRGGGGAIVCTSSDGAMMGLPALSAYCASKAGVNALVHHVAARWGKEGIRCNAVSPGVILSDAGQGLPEDFKEQTLAGNHSTRLGRPEDIANAVAYLVSDDASWVTGQVFSVNGGGLLR